MGKPDALHYQLLPIELQVSKFAFRIALNSVEVKINGR